MTTSVLLIGQQAHRIAGVHFGGQGQILGGLHARHHRRPDFALGSQHSYPHGLHPRRGGRAGFVHSWAFIHSWRFRGGPRAMVIDKIRTCVRSRFRRRCPPPWTRWTPPTPALARAELRRAEPRRPAASAGADGDLTPTPDRGEPRPDRRPGKGGSGRRRRSDPQSHRRLAADKLCRGPPPAAGRRTAFSASDSHRPRVATGAAGHRPGMARRRTRRAAPAGDSDLLSRPARTRHPLDIVEDAERFLAEQAVKLRPDQLDKAAHRIALRINPDGKFSDSDRARQRGFTWCGQRPDGMSVGKLVASPELRANLDAWLARFAAPGMCNPDDEYPCVAGEPAEEAVEQRHSHTGPAPARRAQRLGPRSAGRSETRSAQRVAGDGHRVDHAAGADDGHGPSGDGRRDAAARCAT